MSTTYYDSIGGQILGESTSGVQTDYMFDALGSVTGTKNASGGVQNTYRYKPYGGLLVKAGTAADPKFQWNGGSGYRATGRAHSDYFARTRHLGTARGGWTSVDRYWPAESAWSYVSGKPAVATDPAGTFAAQPVGTPYVSCCSGYDTYIKWSNIPAVAGGWIIQHITRSITGLLDTDCKTQLSYGCMHQASPIEYYEAWQVTVAGGIIVQNCRTYLYGGDDEWSFSPQQIGDYRRTLPAGNYYQTGEAIYVEGYPTGFSVFQWGALSQCGAGCLLAAAKWPYFSIYLAQQGVPVAVQWATYDWNFCCSCKGSESCVTTYGRYPSSRYTLDDDCNKQRCPKGCDFLDVA